MPGNPGGLRPLAKPYVFFFFFSDTRHGLRLSFWFPCQTTKKGVCPCALQRGASHILDESQASPLHEARRVWRSRGVQYFSPWSILGKGIVLAVGHFLTFSKGLRPKKTAGASCGGGGTLGGRKRRSETTRRTGDPFGFRCSTWHHTRSATEKLVRFSLVPCTVLLSKMPGIATGVLFLTLRARHTIVPWLALPAWEVSRSDGDATES